jgi:hypothetical protein
MEAEKSDLASQVVVRNRQNCQVNEDEHEVETCPLFMDGLPSNFEKNSALAAIASFLDDDSVETEKNRAKEERVKVVPAAGGGKIRRSSRPHSQSNRSPYKKPIKKYKDQRAATLGEAQLFLNMWKI